MTSPATVLMPRDHDLVRCAWSLGWATSSVLTDVVAPQTAVRFVTRRLRKLTTAGYLRRRRVVGGAGHLWLYGTGRNAAMVDPAYREAWRPSDAQLLHTLAVGETLAALLSTGRLGTMEVTAWRGEAELRTWHRPGEPIPDLQVDWSAPGGEGRWCVEVDRGTESRNAWRRKFARYLHARGYTVLVVTTSDTRARNLALLARELGVPALTTDLATVRGEGTVLVYDAINGVRRAVDE